MCLNTQQEYRSVAKQIKKEICDKVSPAIAKYFKRPCERLGYCISAVPCGKTKYRPRKKKSYSKWLKG